MNNTRDHGYETMVFAWSKRRNEVKDWDDWYYERYKSDSDMWAGHNRICENLEAYLEED